MAQTVLVVEDDELIVESLRYGLEHEGYRVLTAGDGVEGLRLANAEAPDLVLMDVMMPIMDGREACRALRSISNVPIIMLTARGEEMDKVIGLELGADDYVVKPFGMRELVARIRAQLRRTEMPSRGGAASGSRVVVGDVELDRDSHVVSRSGRVLDLRPKEYDLLSVLMTQPGHAFERSELLDAVWGEGWFGDPRTLDVHMRWLRQKLEDEPAQPRYLLTVRGTGYRFAQPDEVASK
jgi:DNA-binding response OmpR family regulator